MFGMLPFERSDDNLFDTFDNFTRNFFRSSNASLPAFRTDIRDDGDKFVLEAELPGPLNLVKKPLLKKLKGTVVEKVLRDHHILRDGML